MKTQNIRCKQGAIIGVALVHQRPEIFVGVNDDYNKTAGFTLSLSDSMALRAALEAAESEMVRGGR